MAIQIIIDGAVGQSSAQTLLEIDEEIEVFSLAKNRVGISIPTKVVDKIGEPKLRKAFATFHHYDLWSGDWHLPSNSQGGLFSRLLGKT